MKINKLLYTVIFMLAFGFTSCESFLDSTPTSIITGEALTDDDLPKLTSPLYNVVWADFNGQFYYGLGDGRAYNLYAPFSDYIYPFHDLNESGLTGPLVNAWASFYVIVQQANNIIITINQSSASQEAKNKTIAEARFMRGLAYWYLTSLWGNVIICEDPAMIINNPLSNTNPRKDSYEFAIRDMEFAAKYLPETVTDEGRVTKYAAFGMLSRFYLDYSGLVASNYGENPNVGTRDAAYLDLAKKAAEKVINESQYKLLPSYPDLFIPTKELNNNSEILFALQWIPGLTSSTGWQLTNTQQAYFA
ncbi:MAG: RagB/SusD family nutrient uptake outer membrane protein, partial [Paludibacter sp.]|nr:RagB/SusD family nutrient uptake outer membrane protein [Paludibacter sp.]